MGITHDANLSQDEIRKANQAKIWRVALILAIVTIIEFIFAFSMEPGIVRTSLFFALTIIKAFYIVAEFMHLRHEVKTLIYAIIMPMVFVIWLVIALLYDGSSIFSYLVK
ncbi:MAG: cytochrome C oxidase subunit IV family protein [Cytophagales bacterium]|nr:cytochrome C oxidase subunit IV family protein [Cytophagales bacterium]MDW8383703.1 cytochrome C oxidase subunit IV family protein [Flammeovirgaceae bacterium]